MGNSLTANPKVRSVLAKGIVIPAHPLALSAGRGLDERRQRALTRYYVAAGAGGVAVGVHTTQFAIRDPRIGLFEPVLRLAAEELDRHVAHAHAGFGHKDFRHRNFERIQLAIHLC